MTAMLYRRFGRTELPMPVFSCGGMRYQHQWKDIPAQDVPAEGQANLEATIHRALDLGINHIETARGYGSSEMQLGWILPRLPRQKLIIQTKVAPCEDPRQFLDTFNKSMGYLKLDYVDLFSLHGINTRQLLEFSIRPGGCLDAARKLQKEGRCRFVGFSTHGSPDVILDAIRADGLAGSGFDYVNLHWYYIFQRNWQAIEEATRRDMGVFIISPSDKGGKLYAPPAKLVDLCRPLHPLVFNDLFCLARPQVHTLSIGAARPSDFDRHVQTLALLDGGADSTLAPIERRIEDAMHEATGARSPEQGLWSLPGFEDMPGNMNVAMILWLMRLARGWDMVEYGRMRYNLLGNGGHWFPGRDAAELDQLDHQALREAMGNHPDSPRIVELLIEAHELLGGEQVQRLSRT